MPSVRLGIPQSTISAIENGRVNLGVERAKLLARALQCHPAVLVFPGRSYGSPASSSHSATRSAVIRCSGISPLIPSEVIS